MPTPSWRRSQGRQAGGDDHQCAPRFTVAELERVELAPYFERLISSHDYGYPKESPQFWDALQADIGFEPARSLFIDDTLADPAQRPAVVGHLLAVAAGQLGRAARYPGVCGGRGLPGTTDEASNLLPQAVKTCERVYPRRGRYRSGSIRNTQHLPRIDLVRCLSIGLLASKILLYWAACHTPPGNGAEGVALLTVTNRAAWATGPVM
jgi:hypothetical protein